MTSDERTHGVDLNGLAEQLDELDYPLTAEDLRESHGDAVIELAEGTATVDELLGPNEPDQTFDTPSQVREVLLTMVDDDAIAREGYSDRTRPGPGEDSQHEQQSF